MAAPPIDLVNEYGYVWLPYAIGAVLVLVLGAWVARQSSSGRPIRLTKVLLVRGGLLALLAGAAMSLADGAVESDGLTVIDRPIWQWVVEHRSGFATGVFTVITQVGSTVVMTVIAVAMVGFLTWRRRWDDAALLAVVSGGAGLIVMLGKNAIGRVRPPEEFRLVRETNESFPSGHSLASIAVLGAVVVLVVPALHTAAARWWVAAAAAVAVVAIGVSRIYLGVHWTTDVLGGWASGAAWLVLCVTGRTVWRVRRAAVSAAGTAPVLAPAVGDDADQQGVD